MAFPSSFDTQIEIASPPGEVDADMIASRIAQSFANKGATIVSRDGPYLEFRYTLRQSPLVPSGSVSVTRTNRGFAIRGEVAVRALPAIVLFPIPALILWSSGEHIGALLSAVLVGVLFQLVYMKALFSFRDALRQACKEIGAKERELDDEFGRDLGVD